ncbi:MAG: hypothetical protein ABSG83_12420 [Roseiarcus sp.]|jgi:hypothetical protein
MQLFPRNLIVVAAAVAGLTAATCARAETTQHRHKDKTHAIAVAPRRAPDLAPGVELRASTYASPGSENHYYSDTVASSHSNLMDMTHRYGQSTAPEYNSSEPLFRF